MRTVLLLVISFLFMASSYAGLHFEPLAYFAIGEASEKDTGTDYKHQGYLYGVRLGLYKPRFQLGLEYKTGELTYEEKTSNSEVDQTPHYMGAYLGLNLQKRVGLNLSYFPEVRFNADSTNKLSGNAWKVELYYRLKTHVSFKLGYQHTLLDYDEVADASLSNKTESKTILVGLSFPFVL